MTSPVLTPASELEQKWLEFKLDFLERTGYSDQDLLAWNPHTAKFAMRNGGLYQVLETREIEHLGGPSPDPADRL